MNSENNIKMPQLVLHPIKYPIPAVALANWWKFDLKRRATAGGGMAFTFRYLGSTCTNSGTPIDARLHAELRPGREGMIVERAWIEFDEEDEGHQRMCEYGARGQDLVAELGRPAAFCGRTLEEAIAGLGEVNPAGCFCGPAMINNKWRQMLCAIHFGLSQKEG